MPSPAASSEPGSAPRAVFLSYARDDTAAAQRIAEALRSQGIEVWFDQSELRGGDAWDAKIRQQIADCALFLPVISRQTQKRSKGYFRLEWKLAVEQTHQMLAGVPFLVPVVVDDTLEKGATVPEEFLRVQWIRLAEALPTPQFIETVKRLLSGTTSSSAASAGSPMGMGPLADDRTGIGSRTSPRKRWGLAAVLAMIAIGVGLWRFGAGSHSKGASAAGLPVIVLMDTPYATHVYDPATLQSGGTNADDITDLLRGLPVKIVKETTSGLWRREQQVIEENPALIVIHRSCFDSFPDDQNLVIYPLVDNKLVAFMGYVATLNPRTKFIVYSRHSWENAEIAAKWKKDATERFPVLAGKLETWRVPLDRATFRNPVTGQELKDSVQHALGLSELADK